MDSSEVSGDAVEGQHCDAGEDASKLGDATHNVNEAGPGLTIVGENTSTVACALTADGAQTGRRSTIGSLGGASSSVNTADTTTNITHTHNLDRARATPSRTNASVITDSNDGCAAISDLVSARVGAASIAPANTSSLVSHPDLSPHVPSTACVDTLTRQVTTAETECVPGAFADEPSSPQLTEPQLQRVMDPCQNRLPIVDMPLGNGSENMDADDEVLPAWVTTDVAGLRKMGGSFDPEKVILREKWDKLIDIWIAHERQCGFHLGDGASRWCPLCPRCTDLNL